MIDPGYFGESRDYPEFLDMKCALLYLLPLRHARNNLTSTPAVTMFTIRSYSIATTHAPYIISLPHFSFLSKDIRGFASRLTTSLEALRIKPRAGGGIWMKSAVQA